MEQIERIKKMEALLDEAEKAVREFAQAQEQYLAVQNKIKELEQYYQGPDWRQDFEDDSDGKLPSELKRGVLSEDAVYDLLMENDELMATIKTE